MMITLNLAHWGWPVGVTVIALALVVLTPGNEADDPFGWGRVLDPIAVLAKFAVAMVVVAATWAVWGFIR